MTSAAAARPLVSVQGTKTQIALPSVFLSPIRTDVVHHVFRDVNKNHRQAYAPNEVAGMQHSAQSWGTGRAVARVPRVAGSGTHAAGQGAFANMCRKGRRFAPNKVWRRWHRKVAQGQRRFAVCSALAASAVPALVMARGHRVENVNEVPLVCSDAAIASISKTKAAQAFLSSLHVDDDITRCQTASQMRAGRGKNRGRRFKERRGPLVVVADSNGDNFTRALRNIEGVDIANVSRLNLLALAPGGHVGRFIVWTESAMKELEAVYASKKHGFTIPRAKLTNADLGAIINSSAVQSVVRPAVTRVQRYALKKNPLKNLGAMVKLNPYAEQHTRNELLAAEKAAKTGVKANKRKATAAIKKATKETAKRRKGTLTSMLL